VESAHLRRTVGGCSSGFLSRRAASLKSNEHRRPSTRRTAFKTAAGIELSSARVS
jgi:hypothetical protein